MIFEPLVGKREAILTERRTAIDFADTLKYTSDIFYPLAEKIVLVTDNLNTHTTGSLYKAFPPKEANRLAKRFEWHYTPKHGSSWLDMAEIEISILSRQTLAKPIPDMASFQQQVKIWTSKRNSNAIKANWQFATLDSHIKLKNFYPEV